MKEIKAYIRRRCLNETVRALEEESAPGITVVEIHPVGYGYEPNYFELHYEDALRRYSYLQIVKIELVCADGDSRRFVDTILKVCRTGDKGDGMVFITDVADAIRIRDGVRGESAL